MRPGSARYLRTEKPSVLDRRIEITGRRSDGCVFPVELTVTRIALPGSPVFAGYLRDLSDKHRAQEELRASRLRGAEAVLGGPSTRDGGAHPTDSALFGGRLPLQSGQPSHPTTKTLGILPFAPAGTPRRMPGREQTIEHRRIAGNHHAAPCDSRGNAS